MDKKNFSRTALAALSTFSFLILFACEKHDAANAQAAPPPAKLGAVVLNVASVTSGITATGTILAEQQVDVQTEVAGKVVEIGFPEGGSVSAGQVLVKLDESELKAQLEKASSQLDLSQVQEKRVQEQATAGAVSAQDADQARAQLESAKGDVDLLKAQIAKCEIKAPFAGHVGLRLVELGAVVQPGTKITALQDLRSFRIDFSIPESQAMGTHVGMPISFNVAGLQDTLQATVFAIEPGVDPDTRLLNMRARCAAPKGGLLPGGFATVNIPLHERLAIWIPAQAVVEGARGSQAWRVRGGKAELVVFQPGTRTPESVESMGGLSAGDTILISGLMQLKPGASVNPNIAQH